MASMMGDPRVFFAAERTLLAWVRTGLTDHGVRLRRRALRPVPAPARAQQGQGVPEPSCTITCRTCRHRAGADRRRCMILGASSTKLRVTLPPADVPRSHARSTRSCCASCWRCWASCLRSTSRLAPSRLGTVRKSGPIPATGLRSPRLRAPPMLQPAHVGHLAMLRSLIRQGAQDGSFDRELGATSPEAEAFFAKLKRALVTGYFVEEGRTGQHRHGRRSRLRVLARRPQHRHAARRASASSAPSTAVTSCGSRASTSARAAAATAARCWRRCSRRRRGRRPGSCACSAGRATSPRCSTCSPTSASCLVGDTLRLRWFLRTDAPAELASRVRDAVDARSALN